MDDTGDQHVRQNKPDSKRQISVVFFSYLEARPKKMKNYLNIKGKLFGICKRVTRKKCGGNNRG
jgi:aromatic ring-opening dioxygenase LigB subunit